MAGEPGRQGRVVVIERDAQLRRELATVFQLLGHPVEAVAPRDLATGDLPAPCALLALGPSEDALPPAIESAAEVPVLALRSGNAPRRAGAVAELAWPASLEDLVDGLHRCALTRHAATGDEQHDAFPELIGLTTPMQRVRAMMGRVVARDANVFITGESGTGKEVVARALHAAGPRAAGPFVPVNCGAIPPELLESELFGHEKGAFTGALSARPGRFELASGGTLFLDEIGDLPLPMQVKLLRVIQERVFERVGGVETLRCDVRLVAATHHDLEAMIAAGTFREDLYYRLAVFPIELPPLRERLEDLDLLVNELNRRGAAAGLPAVRFTSAARASLRAHAWPGNVRELANLVERMAIMHGDTPVGESDLPSRFRHLDDGSSAAAPAAPAEAGAGEDRLPSLPVNGLDLKDYLGRLERQLIEQALADTNSVVARAADRLHIRRTTLVEKMRKYGISRQDQQAGDGA